METKVLTQEELQEIKNIQKEKTSLIEQFGILEYNLQDLEHQKQELKANLIKLKGQEFEISSKLQTKYGVGTINMEKGEFTPIS